MKIRPDKQSGSVVICLTAREALRIAQQLVESAVRSGAPVEADEPTPETEQPNEEQVP